MADALRDLSDDELRDEVTTWAGRVAAGEAKLLLLVGELDARGAWVVHGVRSCAHWLSWQLGMSPNAARERVRVARCLRDLPLISGAFSRGELSWTQVRALTRIATPAEDEQLLSAARRSTGAQLETWVRGIRRAQQPTEDAIDPEQAAWRRRPRVRYDEDGSMVLTLRLPAAQGQLVLAALEQTLTELRDAPAETPTAVPAPTAPGPDAAADADVESAPLRLVPAPRQANQNVPAATPSPAPPTPTPTPAPASPPPPAPARAPTLADALVRLCAQQPISHPKAKTRLKVLLDPLTGWSRTAGGELLPPGTLPDTLTAPTEPLPLTRHDRGRDNRDTPGPLRTLLGQVDGERCRFPGCWHVRHLHAHHVTWWQHGGRTDLNNLVLMCSYHHQYLHQFGYQLQLYPDRRLVVTAPDGVLVPRDRELLWQPVDTLDPHGAVTAATLPPQWDGSGLDLHHAVWAYLHRAAA